MRALTAALILVLPLGAAAQEPSRFDLVRCVAGSDVPCLRAAASGRTGSFTIPAAADGIAGLGRTATLVTVPVARGTDSATSVVVSWRPPLVAMPAFRGVADSAALSPAVREALLIGASTGGDRTAIALLVGILVACCWLLLARFGPPPLDLGAPARERGATTRIEPAAAESDPRDPGDVTKQTARGTAMRR